MAKPKNHFTITMLAEPDTSSPEHQERTQKFSPGFAQAVREQQKKAEKPWGWCTVVVTATLGEFKGEDTLSGCSYLGPMDFIKNSCYFEDMVNEAVRKLKENAGVKA